MFPVWLDLKGRRCLVVGGGAVALRKVLGLLDAEASVVVIAPDVVPALSTLVEDRLIGLERRPYRRGDAADGYVLVLAATSEREVNLQVARDAAKGNVFVNVADDPDLCTFYLPGRVRRGPLEIALSSAGKAPFLVRRLREALEAMVGAEWRAWSESGATLRQMVRRKGLTGAQRQACFDRFVAETFDRERFVVRIPSDRELHDWVLAASTPGPGTVVSG